MKYVYLLRLQGNVGKQRKGEKCPDTAGTQTRDSGLGDSSLNHQTTSAPNDYVCTFQITNCEQTLQPLGTRSNCCRSRKSIRGHIPMYNLLPVYILYFLQALSLVHFISTIPNNNQQKEQLFCCLLVLDL